MPVRKRKVNGQWIDIGSEVLKTNINVVQVEEPSIIEAGDEPYLVCLECGYVDEDSGGSDTLQDDVKLIIQKAGTYTFKTGVGIGEDSGSNFRARIHRIRGTTDDVLSETTIGSSGGAKNLVAQNVECQVGDIIQVSLRGSQYSYGYDYDGYCNMLIGYIKNPSGELTGQVKRKSNNIWSQFQPMPLHVPIELEQWENKYIITDNLIVWNNSSRDAKTATITIPKNGQWTISFSISSWNGYPITYHLNVNNNQVKSGSTSWDTITYTNTFNVGDVVDLYYKCATYQDWSTYYVGTVSALVAHYDN